MEDQRTIYIDGRPVWEIGNAEVEPAETETQTGPLYLVVEGQKAKLMGRVPYISPPCEALRQVEQTLGSAWEVLKEYVNACWTAIFECYYCNAKHIHLYKYCKKLRVRKKYRNRIIKELSKQKEADE